MGGFYKRVVATHVIYQNNVYDIDTFVSTIGAGGGNLVLLPNNTVSIPLAADTVIDFATTANLATGVISLPAHIPATATHVLARVRANMNNSSSIPSRTRLTLYGPIATSHGSYISTDITSLQQDLPTKSSLHWVDIQTGTTPYPGINWQFEKGGTTPLGFFNVQLIGYRE